MYESSQVDEKKMNMNGRWKHGTATVLQNAALYMSIFCGQVRYFFPDSIVINRRSVWDGAIPLPQAQASARQTIAAVAVSVGYSKEGSPEFPLIHVC